MMGCVVLGRIPSGIFTPLKGTLRVDIIKVHHLIVYGHDKSTHSHPRASYSETFEILSQSNAHGTL